MQLSLSTIEDLIKTSIKAKDQLAVDTLRGLKTRIQNEQISKQGELSEDDILKLVSSEVKRRKEAVEAFTVGGRPEAAQKEQAEIEVLSQFLPAQLSEQEIETKIMEEIQANAWVAADFGKAMGLLKAHFGSSADGALVAKILKEKLS